MLALSTAWKSTDVDTGFEILNAIREVGFPAIELEYRITESMFRELRPSLKRNDPEVTSVHNIFPATDPVNRTASLDLFHLSSVDKEERQEGIKLTQNTIRIANDLEVPAIVVHLGEVEMEDEMNTIRDFYKTQKLASEEGKQFIDRKLQEREDKSKPHWDAVLFSLEKINREAERQNIFVGLETRYHYHEIPSFHEFQILFKKFEGSNLRYWHDAGHAQVRENLGFESHERYLQAFSDQLIGMHLHDVVGTEDHLAPNYGEVNFDMIKKYLRPNVARVIEVKSTVTKEDLMQGAGFLQAKGF